MGEQGEDLDSDPSDQIITNPDPEHWKNLYKDVIVVIVISLT